MRRAALLCAALAGCVRPGDERALLDLDVGDADLGGLFVSVADEQAQVTANSDGSVTLWAQAPAIEVTLDNRGDGAADLAGFEVVVENALVGAEVAATIDDRPIRITERQAGRATQRRFDIDLPAGSMAHLSMAPPTTAPGPFRFAVMGDVQTALPRFDEVLEAIDDVPDLDFVMCTGDLVEDGKDEEWELVEQKLQVLDIPFYSTIGNHEVKRQPEIWNRLFGRYNVHFLYRGVAFSFIDSANATIDPEVRDRLSTWLDESKDRVHFFGTHYPLSDPVGSRSASFRSRKEASSILSDLAEGNVDVTFYGHVHSFYAFSNAGIPAYISGGGGAWPERWDGVGRHFLVVDVDPATADVEVGIVRVDGD